ncbi:glycerophosphoryl diester phosphodiesterase [Nonomuraea solani]|uniref:Glycerophosphoryl diester phosphodiesterase n=1 Tax=Nonomuraea solani TaxID=1144553 RepID=A0A1H5VUH8_9ACTN|nr:glycerophosphodiester phosphodiesterase family protein [Nonomuraea solani]SEF90793.1 glycerophosphoryl diester phosphodiesterase [Nonomuraea solani]
MYGPLGSVVIATLTALTALTAVPRAAAAGPPEVETIAHRGGSAYAPENTIAACAVARSQRADLCEFDVQQTRDHQLVLMHDQTLARTTDVERVFPGRSPWRVSDFTLAEIRRLDAGSWFSPRYRGEGVPTLAQALQAMGGETGLLLEIKHSPRSPDIDRRVAVELQESRAWWTGKRLGLQAFGWHSMRVLRSMLPDVPVSLLGKPPAARLTELARYAGGITLPHAGLTKRYVARVHERGMRVYTWTTDRPSVIRRLISYGVDGIMTNKPDRFLDVRP